jgi:hypothetical protein
MSEKFITDRAAAGEPGVKPENHLPANARKADITISQGSLQPARRSGDGHDEI